MSKTNTQTASEASGLTVDELRTLTEARAARVVLKLSDEDRRDLFAAFALTSMVSGNGAQMVANRDGRYDENNWAQVVALNAYEFADALLAEREKTA